MPALRNSVSAADGDGERICTGTGAAYRSIDNLTAAFDAVNYLYEQGHNGLAV